MKRSIDYGLVADLYDSYVAVTSDIPFFMAEASRCDGPVLELMSGTGRVSIPLIEAGVPLTCVDYSREMLARLCAKVHDRSGLLRAVLADVRALPFARDFALAILPFNSFGEIIDYEGQLAGLRSIRGVLNERGVFICTLHNPSVRLRSVDGELRTVARSPHPSGEGELVLRTRLSFDERTRVVSGLQLLEERAADGILRRERRMGIQFALPTREEFEERARSAGFIIDSLCGDYDRSSYDEQTSPYMIWRLSVA